MEIYHLFEKQVKANPDKTAVIFEGQLMTYHELNIRANQLAFHLRYQGVGPGSLVAISVERSLEFMVGLLGILKAGGAYVPIDPSYPQKRLDFILEDTKTPLLLTQASIIKKFTRYKGKIFLLDADWQQVENESQENPTLIATLGDPVYVIYTSGTTGKPKGVLVEHQNLTNSVNARLSYYTDPVKSFLLLSSIAFDSSIAGIFWSLAQGGTLILPKQDIQYDPKEIINVINHHSVSHILCVPSLYSVILTQAKKDDLNSLQTVIVAGESCSNKLVMEHSNLLQSTHLFNEYGPTEATVWSSVKQLYNAGNKQVQEVNIGKPIANVKMYILDNQLKPVSIGTQGEIYIGGAGIVRGYLNQPELTAERFILNPFDNDYANSRLYKTGDLASYLPNGEIKFLGRVDHQVKLRGYRIELEEIEAVLANHQEVKEAIVVAQGEEKEPQQLVAYVIIKDKILNEDAGGLPEDLREYLKERLPLYMVPSAFVILESFPLTPNGKIDRKALSTNKYNIIKEKAYVAPRTAVEKQLADIWSDLLDVEQVGIHDNFFQVGGDSIIAIQLIGRIREYGIYLTIKKIFDYPTIAQLAVVAEVKFTGEPTTASQGPVSGVVLLTPIQEWFFEQEFKDFNYWNQDILLESQITLVAEYVETALSYLRKQHDALRIRFKKDNINWEQYYCDLDTPEEKSSAVFNIIDLTQVEYIEQEEFIYKEIKKINEALDVEKGPIFGALLFNSGSGHSQKLFLVAHHLIIDGISWRILLEDFETIYKQLAKGENVRLINKTHSYQDWALALKNYAQSNSLKSEIEYWIKPKVSMVTLPKDFDKGPNIIGSSKTFSLVLNKDLTITLLNQVPQAYHTQINDILLTALTQTISDWTKQHGLGLWLEGHGREEIQEGIDVTRTIGWFTSVFPIYLNLNNSKDLGDAIKTIKEQLRQLPCKGIGYGILNYLTEDKQRIEELNNLPKPEVIFNYLGQWDNNTHGIFKFVTKPGIDVIGQDNARQYVLDINCFITEHELNLEWTYSINHYKQATIENLSQIFIEKLGALITHCCKVGITEYTPSDFPLVQLNQEGLDKLLNNLHGVEDLYPLSPMQSGLLFHTLYEPQSEAYFLQNIFDLKGTINVQNLKSAWEKVVEKHEILRTGFIWEGTNEPLQYILQSIKTPWHIYDWRSCSITEQKQKLESLLQADRQQGFNFTSAPLFRLQLIELSDSNYKLILSIHHILLDGWCLPLILQELLKNYAQLEKGETLSLKNCHQPYREYIIWLKLQDLIIAKQFWGQYLANLSGPTILGIQKSYNLRNIEVEKEYAQDILTLSEAEVKSLKRFTQQHHLTLNTVLQGVWAILLNYYTKQEDIVFGVTVSGRSIELPHVDKMIGLFINTLPLRIQISSQDSLFEVLQKVQSQLAYLHQYAYTPLANIQAWCSNSESLFESIFVFENYVFDQQLNTELKVTDIQVIEKTEYPLTLAFLVGQALTLKLTYQLASFEKDSITTLANHFRSLLNTIIETPQITLKNLSLLSEKEKQQIIYNWNQTDKDYPSDVAIHELFEEQVKKTPDNIALVYEGTRVTYRELNERANQLAHYLKSKHEIKPDTLIALCLDRSEHMLIAILGVLKAGGAYVPMDPSYPNERMEYILEDTNTQVVLTNEAYLQRLKDLADRTVSKPSIVAIDNEQTQQQFKEELLTNPVTAISSINLAYIIYTSGTTGNPKGVMIEHQGLVNRIKWMNDRYPLNEEDKILQKTPYVFDVSVWEILWSGCYGACVVFAIPEGHKDASYIIDLMNKESITVTHFVPSMLSVFEEALKAHIKLSDLKQENPIASLRYIFCSGEELNLIQVKECHNLLPYVELHNLYGPTEASIDVLFYDCTDKNIEVIYIGKPISNTRCYVLDDNLNPLPIGVVGELYIGGVGLARGYLNQHELTAEKFIVNPFQTEEEQKLGKNGKLYKTGDLVRWIPDGNLEYIGRNDFQVKIRGYRIELGEIESIISSYNEVVQSVVLAKEHKNVVGEVTGNKYLVGYYVSKARLDEDGILSYLQTRLPEYMVPSILVHLEKLPLTINGKSDRKALPDPEFSSSDSYVAPRNELESQVCHIWSEVLGLAEDKVGIRDDFFRLGGDSIVSIQLVSRLRQRLGLNVSVKDIFSYKNIERLHDNVLNKASSNTKLSLRTEQGLLSGEVALLPIQEWFFESNFTAAHHWNQSFIIKTPVLDLNKLRISISKLVEHHDSFRLRYKKNKDSVVAQGAVANTIQYYDSNAKIEELKTLDIRTLTAKQGSKGFETELQSILTNWQSSFDLAHGPVYSIGYIYGYSDGSAQIYFALHHLIVDAVSWRILVEDLRDIYNGKDLSTKGSSYRQWAEVVKNYADTYSKEQEYWSNVVVDYHAKSLTKLVVSEETQNLRSFQLAPEQTQQLLKESNRAYHTQVNDILLTALGFALSEITGSRVNHIILEGHGREEIDSSIDITRTIGWFTTMYPVRLEICEEIGNSLKNIKESLRTIPNKGIGYGAVIGYGANKLPRVSFNYLGQFDKEDNVQAKSWNIVGEGSGDAMHPTNYDNNILNINGLVIGGRLEFNIASKLDEDTTNKVAELFKQKLEDIISHCTKQNIIEYTMGDFDDFEPYVSFNEKVKGNRLFIFPPGDSGAESYFNNIVPKLRDINLILFNNYYIYLKDKLGTDSMHYTTYEKLASNYIHYIKLVQPNGPYNLFGWSFGGVLLFEVARQLINAGHTVANIILIDSFFNYKTAVLETNTKLIDIEPINYNYSPSLDFKLTANVMLFKAVKADGVEKFLSLNPNDPKLKSAYKICKYYAETTKCNHLDKILKNQEFKVINMDYSHLSWIDNDAQVIKICNEISNFILNKLKQGEI